MEQNRFQKQVHVQLTDFKVGIQGVNKLFQPALTDTEEK